jgi:hypothetical protein
MTKTMANQQIYLPKDKTRPRTEPISVASSKVQVDQTTNTNRFVGV